MKIIHLALLIVVACAVTAQAAPQLTNVATTVAASPLDASANVAGAVQGAVKGNVTIADDGTIYENGVARKLGVLNRIVSMIINLLRGIFKGIGPYITMIYDYLMPYVRMILSYTNLHPCQPRTSVELLIWDAKEVLNKKVRDNLGLPTVPLCEKGTEVPPTKEARVRITGLAGIGQDDAQPEAPQPPATNEVEEEEEEEGEGEGEEEEEEEAK